jgi:hypothetical protein
LTEFFVASSFETLSDIIHYGAGGGADLVAEAVVFAKRFLGGQLENEFAKGSCILPDIELFEVGDFHGKVQSRCAAFKAPLARSRFKVQGRCAAFKAPLARSRFKKAAVPWRPQGAMASGWRRI